jgi:drug/metabolite transporter (DMT)-like permease
VDLLLVLVPPLVGVVAFLVVPWACWTQRRWRPLAGWLAASGAALFTISFVLSAGRSDDNPSGGSSSPLGEAPGWLAAAAFVCVATLVVSAAARRTR